MDVLSDFYKEVRKWAHQKEQEAATLQVNSSMSVTERDALRKMGRTLSDLSSLSQLCLTTVGEGDQFVL